MKYGAVTATTYAEESNFRPDIQQKIKRPGFLTLWFAKMSREAWEYEKRQNQENETGLSIDRLTSARVERGIPSIDQPERAIQFTIYHANGGRVVETRRYDRKTDRNNNSLYVITSDQEFGKEIDKIITMESLKS